MGDGSIAISSINVKDWTELERPIYKQLPCNYPKFSLLLWTVWEIKNGMYHVAQFTSTDL